MASPGGAQVAPLNACFSPAAGEVERARKVVTAFEAAVGEGRASVGVDGKMVDIPVAERARPAARPRRRH